MNIPFSESLMLVDSTQASIELGRWWKTMIEEPKDLDEETEGNEEEELNEEEE